MADKSDSDSERGLAKANKKTRTDVARKGGEAYHEKRGQHGSDQKSQEGKGKNDKR